MNAQIEAPIQWVKVGSLRDIPVRGARRVDTGEQVVAVFRTAADKVFALEDRCPHKGGPLSDGIVHDNCVTCPLHNWVIGLADGQAQGADDGAVERFAVRVDGDTVLLALKG